MRRRLVWLLGAAVLTVGVLCHVYYSHEAAQEPIHIGMTRGEVSAALGDQYCGELEGSVSRFTDDDSGRVTYEREMDWLGRRTTVSVCYDRAGRVSGWERGEKECERVSWRLSLCTLTGY